MPMGSTPAVPSSLSKAVRDGSQDSGGFQVVQSHSRKRQNRNSMAYHTAALTNARNQRITSSQAPSGTSVGPSTLASQLGQSNMNQQPTSTPNMYNASMGPSSSVVPPSRKRPRPTSTYFSTGSVPQVINTPVCKLGRFTRRDFRHGDIIALPFHVPNLNPNVNPADNRLVFTVEGPAYSKRRMFVVMWMHKRDMFCLPLYTFQGTGLRGKPEEIKHEYVCMKNVNDANFVNQGPNPTVEAQCDRDLHPDTTVHLTGGMKVSCQEDITISGRMPFGSFYKLLGLWRDETDYAQRERWRDG